MNAKQAKAIVFVCGLLLFAAAVINLQAADYLAALAWAAVAALAAVLYKTLDISETLSKATYKAVIPMVEEFSKLKETLERGVKATLTMKPGEAPTVRCDLTDEDNPDDDEQLSDEEKRVKRMADEFDELAGRYERLTRFLTTDTYKQLPDRSRNLLCVQHQAMHDYIVALRERILIDSEALGLEVTLNDPTADDPADTPDTSEQGAVAE